MTKIFVRILLCCCRMYALIKSIVLCTYTSRTSCCYSRHPLSLSPVHIAFLSCCAFVFFIQ